MVRAVVRGISTEYLEQIYRIARKPDLIFRLDVSPRVAFERAFAGKGEISFWESGRDLHLKDDLFQSFIAYQDLLRGKFESLSMHHGFVTLDGEETVRQVNGHLRRRLGNLLGIEEVEYQPSPALAHLWE